MISPASSTNDAIPGVEYTNRAYDASQVPKATPITHHTVAHNDTGCDAWVPVRCCMPFGCRCSLRRWHSVFGFDFTIQTSWVAHESGAGLAEYSTAGRSAYCPHPHRPYFGRSSRNVSRRPHTQECHKGSYQDFSTDEFIQRRTGPPCLASYAAIGQA